MVCGKETFSFNNEYSFISAKFRLQRNGKWGSMGVAKADELPHDLSLDIRKGKVYVSSFQNCLTINLFGEGNNTYYH